jgi:hypothetical protein
MTLPEIMPATQAAYRPSYKPISAVLSFIISLDTLHAPVSFLARMRTRAGVESDTRPRLAVFVDDPEYGQRLEFDRSVLPKNGLRNRSPVPKRNPSSGR